MPETRVERWQRRLLDLSLRNRLLNARDGRQLLPLSCEDVAVLEDRLAANAEIGVTSNLPPAECLKRLKEIYRAGRTALEESGVNAVYVAVGFLEWKERPDVEASHRAPILLVPVRLARTSVTSGYRLVRQDEDAHVNTTLLEFLRVDHGLVVEGLDPLPQDEAGTDVMAVFAAFERVAKVKGWVISRTAALGFFSFGKAALWRDLRDRLDEMRRNPLVDHLVTGGGVYDDGITVFPPEEIAAHLDPHALFCPLSADSSQLTAVLYSALGKTFVLHGPPGTGKSQTITNLIVHNLALGRRVLFVSEKKAALDVVHRRLQACGVGPFCLELHSNKTGKAHVLAQFAEALDVPPTGAPAGLAAACRDLENAQKGLSDYVCALHRVHPNGLAAYDVLARLATAHPAASPDLIALTALTQTRERVETLARQVDELASEWMGVDPESWQALRVVRGMGWSPAVEDGARAALTALLAAYEAECSGGMLAALRRRWCGFRLRRQVQVPTGLSPREAAAVLQAALAQLGDSRRVFAYRMRRAAIREAGLGPFALAMEKGKFPANEAAQVFADAYAAKAWREILVSEPALANFSGLSQDDCVRRFRESDKLVAECVKRNVFARLAARLPAGRDTVKPREKSELGVLRRECAKKMRHKPIRQLLAETKGVAMALKPCFLMSPLSVSQYLPPDAEPFDLVVFDEASQIPVWDAVGAIARGRQLIVVGDPKQMPPTNFFQRGEGEDDEPESDEGVEDMESILDEALALGICSSHLDWHYRSRHESLIAFSNAHYYDDRLNTFPSAIRHSPQLGVSLHFVADGVYEARGKRTNLREAEAVVDWVMTEAARGEAARRVGVVTFSLAQKNLIEDLVEKRAAAMPDLAAFFDESRDDPFFVKNLENVQGDERDVILFSVCYAPDAHGDFAMNFGPLNRQGGERRLNVAVTRAREQVVVFSSVHAEQIDLSRTKAVGAAHLKDFLDYAARGGETRVGETAAGDSVLAQVQSFLTEKGYATIMGVGTSDRRVDLAVCRPETDGEFLLGILGDGPGYGADRTVRDRDALRVEVLQNLGWNLMRLWSVDWILDRARTQQRILETLETLSRDGQARLPPPVKLPPDLLKRALKPLPPVGR